MKKLFLLVVLFGQISFAYSQLNMSLLGQLPYSGRGDVSDIWGYVDETGKEYALVGLESGVSVVDVSVPSSPNEVFWTNGTNTIWRDLKTWNDKAYITNEGGNGLMIIDLSPLPGSTSLSVTNYTGNSYPFSTAHNLYIDENGYCYIFGADNGNGGAIILNLNLPTSDPNFEVGRYNQYYLHDGMVRGDTLWGGAIDDGFLAVIDVSNKANPTTMATKNTPSNFCHNAWISIDGHYVYTTDEKSNAYLAAYDVSDLGNITETDRIQSSPGMNVIPHNVHVKDNFIVTSYYRDGVTIHDVTDPNNIIEVGNYDTSPAFTGSGFNGCWGVYPWLPSGNVIASDIENGLFILGATYAGACYLKGNVTDANTSIALDGVQIDLISTTTSTNTNIIGDYNTGIATPGTYNVVYSKFGYKSDTASIALSSGNITIHDVQLIPLGFDMNGQVLEAGTMNPIPNAKIKIANSQISYFATTDASGNFSITSMLEDSYDVIISKWGYNEYCHNDFLSELGNPYQYILNKGYYDDFALDLNWSVSGDATTGMWERGIPEGTMNGGTPSNPGIDVSLDCGEEAFVTGNGGGASGDDDIDGGSTLLTSPVFDATIYGIPYVQYYRWFYNGGGFGSPDDEMTIKISNGSTIATLETITANTPNNSSWVSKSFKIADYITPTNNMTMLIETGDLGQGHLVEAGFDKFEIVDAAVGLEEILSNSQFSVYPNPFSNELFVSVNNDEYKNIELRVLDITGKFLDNFLLSNNQEIFKIENDYDKGVYFVNIYSEGQLIKTQKVVKY